MPSNPCRKSMCHQSRRNSPSVTAWRPIDSCKATTLRMHLSSTARNAADFMSPFFDLRRASCNSGGRKRLPTWSARKGGIARNSTAIEQIYGPYASERRRLGEDSHALFDQFGDAVQSLVELVHATVCLLHATVCLRHATLRIRLTLQNKRDGAFDIHGARITRGIIPKVR